MATIIKSSSSSWVDVSHQLYSNFGGGINSLYNAMEDANKAIDIVTTEGNIGDLSINITYEELEELNEKRRKLVYFANGIHYEISQLVDNPFSSKMGELAKRLYDFDPSNINVKTGSFGNVDFNQTLTSLIMCSIEDEQLKADFESKVESLDNDMPTYELNQAIIEAQYWEKEYQKALECGDAANRIFTEEIRSNWEMMTPEERMVYIDMYKNEVGTILGEGVNITTENVRYEAFGEKFGESHDDYIAINIEFINNPTRNFSVDKLVDTITHEMRHQYQAEIKNNPNEYSVPDNVYNAYAEWAEQGISSTDYDIYYRTPIEEDARAFAAVANLYL